MKNSYYDLDCILMEQELIPVKWNFSGRNLGFLKHIHAPNFSQLRHDNSTIPFDLASQSSASSQSKRDSSVELFDSDIDDESMIDEDVRSITSASTNSSKTSGNTSVVSSTAEHVNERQKLFLPLWLANVLVQGGYVTVQVPRFFYSSHLKQLEAIPEHLNLYNVSPHFFEFSHRIIQCYEEMVKSNNNISISSLNSLTKEPSELRKLLIQIFIKRYLKILTNAHNSIRKEDYSRFTRILTASERELFDKGRRATEEFLDWKYKKASAANQQQFSSTLQSRNLQTSILRQGITSAPSKNQEEEARARKRQQTNDGGRVDKV